MTMKTYITDSRSLTDSAGTCFVAVTTAGNDGHRYIPELYGRGVRDFVVSHHPVGDYHEASFTVVPDTVAYMRETARRHRDTLDGTTVIGITGSVGKTTVKEWLYRSLADRRGVSRSPRSFNSQIGVPLSLLGVHPGDRLAIIEAGVSQSGEMQLLEPVVRPHVGILTPITDEHDAGFESRRAKIAEKLSLFAGSTDVIYPSQPDVEAVIAGAGLTARLHPYDPSQPERILDIIASLGLPAVELAAPERRWHGDVSTRFEIMDGFNDCRIVRDRFTPDIHTLRTALDFMRRQQTPSRTNTLILCPLTDTPGEEDAAGVARMATQYGIDRLILVGTDAPVPFDGIGRVERYGDVAAFIDTTSTDAFGHELVMIYGAEDDVRAVSAFMERQQHETVMEVNLNAMTHNFNLFRSLVRPDTGIICMLKADGYGTGSYQAARTLQSQGAAYIAVAVVDEGVSLRKDGITMPLIVLNPRAENTKTMFEFGLEPEIYSPEMLAKFSRYARAAGYTGFPVHLKFDTGMHRLGFTPDDISAITDLLNSDRSLRAATMFSHLATADCPDMDDYTRYQLDMFDSIVREMRRRLDYDIKAHILNSTGIFRFAGHQYDYVRLGIGLYGERTLDDGTQDALEPVSALYSVIISIKHFKAGESIGYSRRGMLGRDSIVATVPIGYADGLNRHLGNGAASFMINGRCCPIVGNVCMDICMVDVTDLGEDGCCVGDRVEIFGPDIPVSELSDTLGTITYEVLTSVSPRIKRLYYRE